MTGPTPSVHVSTSAAIVRTVNGLNEIAAAINAEAESAVAHARLSGELLLKAKALVPHGRWLAWLEANIRFTPRQAQKLMRLAANWSEIASANANPGSHLTSVNSALALLSSADDGDPEVLCVPESDHNDHWLSDPGEEEGEPEPVEPESTGPGPEERAELNSGVRRRSPPRPAAQRSEPTSTAREGNPEPHPFLALRADAIALTKRLNAVLNTAYDAVLEAAREENPADAVRLHQIAAARNPNEAEAIRLHEIMGLVGVLRHTDTVWEAGVGTTPARCKFIPLAGVPLLLALAAKEGRLPKSAQANDAQVEAEYGNATGTWVPPATALGRERAEGRRKAAEWR